MERTESVRPADADRRGVLALVGALVESGLDLARNTARMAASEGRMVVHRFAVRAGAFVAALFVAASGLLLALVGAAILLARLAGMDQWLAFVVVGLAVLAAGTLCALRAMRRLSDEDIAFRATLAEFATDVEMLRTARTGDGEDHRDA